MAVTSYIVGQTIGARGSSFTHGSTWHLGPPLSVNPLALGTCSRKMKVSQKVKGLRSKLGPQEGLGFRVTSHIVGRTV